LTQAWDKNLPGASRFAILAEFNNQAVRDNNTGLVWEQAPAATLHTWGGGSNQANIVCANRNVGGTTGWRLPSIFELASVMDPSLPAPFVPASVFTDVAPVVYWSSTTYAVEQAQAWLVNFFSGFVIPNSKENPQRVWCVRGAMQESVY
jgi:hypothetical protein